MLCIITYRRAITLMYKPANVGHNNQNNSCHMVRHHDSEVLASCFPQQKIKDRIYVKSRGILYAALALLAPKSQTCDIRRAQHDILL